MKKAVLCLLSVLIVFSLFSGCSVDNGKLKIKTEIGKQIDSMLSADDDRIVESAMESLMKNSPLFADDGFRERFVDEVRYKVSEIQVKEKTGQVTIKVTAPDLREIMQQAGVLMTDMDGNSEAVAILKEKLVRGCPKTENELTCQIRLAKESWTLIPTKELFNVLTGNIYGDMWDVDGFTGDFSDPVTEQTQTQNVTAPENMDIGEYVECFRKMLQSTYFAWESGAVFSGNIREQIISEYIACCNTPIGMYEFFTYSGMIYTADVMDPSSDAEGYKDPEKKFLVSYELDADTVDWILRNVFGVTPDRQSRGDTYYYKGDKIYVEAVMGGGPSYSFYVQDYKAIGNNKYELRVRREIDLYGEAEEYGDFLFVASPSYDAEMGAYWRIYSYSRAKNVVEEEMVGESEYYDDYDDYYNDYDDDYDYDDYDDYYEDDDTSDYEEEIYEGWKKSYLEVIDNITEEYGDAAGDCFSYYLLNIDGDSVPELYVDYGSTAGGSELFTYCNGASDSVMLYVDGLAYIEGSGVFRDSGGHMGIYYDEVYEIRGGSISCVGRGDCEQTDIYSDAMEYFWNDEAVTEQEYSDMLNSLFNEDRASYPYSDDTSYSHYEIAQAVKSY